MLTAIITIHFRLARRTCIRHWDVVSTWPGVTDGAVLWCVFRTSISIGRATSCTTCKFRRDIGTRLLCPVAMVLRVVNLLLLRSKLLLVSMFASFL